MYLYETHLHTSQVSLCARSAGAEYVKAYADLGYAGIMVTDHFIRGNCLLDASGGWAEFVKRFAQGYEEARNQGEKSGLQVFFGWEETYDGDDYLIYGLSPEWLLQNPQAAHWTRLEQFQQVHAAGGCVVQAHPFRQAGYIRKIHLSPRLAHAFEAFNAGNLPQHNLQAYRFAKRYNILMTAGSDIHDAQDVRRENLMGVAFKQKLECGADYARAIRRRAPFGLEVPAGHILEEEPAAPSLDVVIYDTQGNPLGRAISLY